MKNKIITIPNILSVIRVILIIPFTYLYFNNCYVDAVIFLAISGLTDIADGLIARRFNMITNLGKIIDPLADKITQITIAVCLMMNHPILIPFVIIFALKELSMLIASFVLLRRNEAPQQATWWGKISSLSVYFLFIVFLIMDIFNAVFSDWFLILIMTCVATLSILSLTSYYTNYKKQKR